MSEDALQIWDFKTGIMGGGEGGKTEGGRKDEEKEGGSEQKTGMKEGIVLMFLVKANLLDVCQNQRK